VILECQNCQALVSAEFIEKYPYFISEEESGIKGGITSAYEFWKCPNCQKPFVTDNDEVWGRSVLYPTPSGGINPMLPQQIKAAYSEARSCYKSKAYTATAIMCRKTLEGICAEHGVTGNNLVKNLKELKDKGIIENRLYEWADALRISGNEAAHDVNVTISQEDARDVLEFTNALLEYIFTFRDRFEKFKQRRVAQSSKQKTDQESDTEVPF
jgi:hypothetical protein